MADIYSEAQLYAILSAEVLSPLVKFVSEKIVEEVRKFILENQPISTKTVRKYVTYDTTESTNEILSTIYIDDESMQSEQEPYAYGSYSKFMSFGLKSRWDDEGGDGMSISYHLVEWLEETGTMQGKTATRGGRPPHGNNPFPPIHMFKNVSNELSKTVPKWVNQYARQTGIEIKRG